MSIAPAPHVIIAAAMGVPAAYYRPLERALHEHGWVATTIPARGIERGSEPPSRSHDWGYAAVVARIRAEVERVRTDDAARPVVLLGHSIGGQAVLGHLLEGGDADGVIFAGCSVPHYRFYGRRGAGLLAMALSVPVVTGVLGSWPRRAFGGPQPRTLMREWARFVRTGRVPYPRTPARHDPIETPSFFLHVEGDTLSVTRSARALTEFVAPSSRTWWDYLRAEAPDGATVDHLSWVKSPGPAVDRIIRWWNETRDQASPPAQEPRSV